MSLFDFHRENTWMVTYRSVGTPRSTPENLYLEGMKVYHSYVVHMEPHSSLSSILYTPALPLGHMIQNSWKNLMPYSAPLWVWGGEWRNINHQQAQLILSFASATELSEMTVSWIQGQLFKTDIILMDSWFVFPWRLWMWKTFWNNTTAEIWCSNTQFLYSPSMPAQFLDILQLVSELQSLKREVARSGGAHL